jgi:DNA ligase-1
VGAVVCKGKDHLDDELKKVEAVHGEGLMLRKPHSVYEYGRSRFTVTKFR